MTTSKDEIAALLSSKKVTYAPNPHWEVVNGEIIDKKYQISFSIYDISNLIQQIKTYFQLHYDSFKSEAQVLVVTSEDLLKFRNKYLPEIKLTGVNDDIHVIVLPQVNVWGNTSISESYWQNEIVAQGITPVARIHSHHILDAYQSSTDWSSLNSGTLEIVIGKIYDEIPHVAYWLDVRGTNNKDIVYKTTNLGETSEIIPCGKPETKPFNWPEETKHIK